MKQTEIWYADLNPVKGSEQSGFRPVVIVSGNLMNHYLNTVICCPLTTKIKNYKGNIVLEPNAINHLKEKSEILTSHIRSVSKERLIKPLGKISKTELETLIKNLNDILRY